MNMKAPHSFKQQRILQKMTGTMSQSFTHTLSYKTFSLCASARALLKTKPLNTHIPTFILPPATATRFRLRLALCPASSLVHLQAFLHYGQHKIPKCNWPGQSLLFFRTLSVAPPSFQDKVQTLVCPPREALQAIALMCPPPRTRSPRRTRPQHPQCPPLHPGTHASHPTQLPSRKPFLTTQSAMAAHSSLLPANIRAI